MHKLTRGERFKGARLDYNQHGKQTMDEVTIATGISKSMIQSLEDDESQRSVGYDKVAILAKHYGVSADWLLGLSEDYHKEPCAADQIGLSADVIHAILDADNETREGLNIFLSYVINRSTLFRDIYRLKVTTDTEKKWDYSSFTPDCLEEWEHDYIADTEIPKEARDFAVRKAIMNEITKKYPQLSGRISINLGNTEIRKQFETICKCFNDDLVFATDCEEFVDGDKSLQEFLYEHITKEFSDGTH